jgi:hypothetical protein
LNIINRYIILGLLVVGLSAHARSDSSRHLKFTSVQQIGFMETTNGLSLDFNLSAGVVRKKLDYMLGTSLVAANFSHYAFYGDVRFYPTKERKFYMGLNSGVTLKYNNQPEITPVGIIYSSERSVKRLPGLCQSAIIGVKARLGREVYYNINLIYNYSTIVYKETYLIVGDKEVTGRFTNLQSKFGLRVGLSF